MKYSVYIMMLMTLFLYGCAQDELLAIDKEETQEVYTVSLKFNGDIQTEETPLSRAETESRDLYGIQVYKDGKYFAAGMFDNTDNITINLLAGSSYKFVCTAVKNGKDKLYGYCYGAFSCDYGRYLVENFNSFYYSSSCYFNYLNYSKLLFKFTNTNTYYVCGNIERFYGELSNYTPSVNGVVNLGLKRVSFGIKVKVSNIIDGNVRIKCYNDYNTFVDVSNLTSNYESDGEIFSMAHVYDAWQYASNYIENITMDVVWNRGVGIAQSWKKTITVKRNAMNTIRIKLGADDSDIGVGVTPEGGEMGGEEEEIPLG